LKVKQNFVPDSDLGSGPRKNRAIFAGELTRSKGVDLLLEAWGIAALEGFELLLIGDGPDRKIFEQKYAQIPRVTWGGRLSRSQVIERVADSRILVFPSLAYENCPMVVLEALSVATPVVAANHPSLRAIIGHEREGLLFEAGNPRALAAALGDALLADNDTWTAWSRAARSTQVERYSEDATFGQLIAIYRAAIQTRSAPTFEGAGVIRAPR
jgi:glycosyltransferase involved in cell wall biosynthesis